MTNSLNTKNLYLIPLLIFFISSTIMVLIVYSVYNQNKKSYLQQTNQTFQHAYNTVYDQHQEFSNIFFSGIIDKIKIENILDGLEHKNELQKDEIRQELLKKLQERDNMFKKKRILSLNIILPDNTIFLKLKNPKSYGKKISDKRAVIKYVNSNKKAVSSFEVGSYGAGYRFVYPIFKNQNYLGMVSFTYDPSAFTSVIIKQYNVLSNFFIKLDSFKKGFLTKSKLYRPSHHNGYVYNLKVLKTLEQKSQNNMEKLIPQQNTTKQLKSNFNKEQIETIYDPKIQMLFTSIPVFNTFLNKHEAVLTIRSSGQEIAKLEKSYILIGLLIIFLMATISTIVYIILKKELQKKNTIKLMLQKDQQLVEQSKMAAMGEMLESIAHQWRQPLSVITTSASSLEYLKHSQMLTDEQFFSMVKSIEESAMHLSTTIDDFRNFYKEEKTAHNFDMLEVLEKSKSLLVSKLNNRSIKIDITNKETIAFGFENEIIQVLMNILNNAIDALEDSINKEKVIQIDIYKNNKYIVTTIQDNAGGIEEDIISEVFKYKFSTKKEKDGTGIGLYMSKMILEKSQGNIEVENRVFNYKEKKYKGACFIVMLPCIDTH